MFTLFFLLSLILLPKQLGKKQILFKPNRLNLYVYLYSLCMGDINIKLEAEMEKW